ncbi:superfamily II DNA/RNA helicase and SNF2 family-related protein [Sinorhizobium fredii NGR234]|uniref:Superfamily II DNA/RNA helicase and SNF2 family-related protein n=1 Tax=Sinorhizobium fredii (strain NBRC 101917 / NGR234) TaxID=394 RepID=C3MI27_SINFN|nr:DEAD/DEAH box helicase [Sinorhizobium fredii]ACP24375.1 superfamily II DNA/RNA helicase and SNF2 family-related protein [Sinorhizobium fredii NGR234]
MIKFDFRADSQAAYVTVAPEKRGWLAAFRRREAVDLRALTKAERATALAVARLRHLDPLGELHQIAENGLVIRHPLVAQLDSNTASALGLPRLMTGYVFKAKLAGTVGSSDFGIDWWWEKNGRTVALPLQGAFLGSAAQMMRLPSQIYSAIEQANALKERSSVTDHWLELGKFRRLFDASDEPASRENLEGFLRNLSVVTCDSVGIAFDAEDETKFFPLPFVGSPEPDPDRDTADVAALKGRELNEFRDGAIRRGAQPAYRVADGKFLIVDRSAAPVLDAIARNAKADEAGRRAFIADAGRIIQSAIERQMEDDGRITALMSPAARAERVEQETSRVWIETTEWVSRVLGVAKWQVTEIEGMQSSGTKWLNSSIDAELADRLSQIEDEQLAEVVEALRTAIAEHTPLITHEVGDIPAIAEVLEALSRRLAEYLRQKPIDAPSVSLDAYLPVTHDNFWEVDFKAAVRPRGNEAEFKFPEAVRTALQPHQLTSLKWQVAAWQAGIPGVLNADEQGLGKTLQTLSFVAWLRAEMDAGAVPHRPFLVVAPTSLLLNWEAEIDRHLSAQALGIPVRLYGSHLAEFKKEGLSGQDIREGEALLDLDKIRSLENGAPVVITTYQTLANFAISLMDLQCAVAIFDEIQFVKNPVTMRAKAAKSLNADFRIGLTGTPIENATKDLWALMDQLFPGALGALAQFKRVFGLPTEENMSALHHALFSGQHERPPLALRRLKTDAAPGLPTKVRILHPREMSEPQMLRYDEARRKGGMMLALLHHIRRISLHPGLLEGETTEEFSASAARVDAAMDILRHIKSKGERALVFVENRDVQAWFAEVVRLEFNLDTVMIINGDTTIDARKEITDRFQRHLTNDGGFDVLVLGPRAAGTGLTLTAANHVIHLSRWWNPAVEEQCNDRTHRIGQTKPVTVHIPLAVHTRLGAGSFDCLLQRLMKRKRTIADRVLWPAEATESETRMLYDAVVEASDVEVGSEALELDGVLEGRTDLTAEMLDGNAIRIRPRRGGASIVVSSGRTVPSSSIRSDTDAAVVSMQVHGVGKEMPVPHSRLTTGTLWPEFVLPE